ncbi:hypothetical protein [Natronorubrum sp. A-ect3]|uniref:hypothetical protein n=1 Tax=Natronorubrum sp. A-ect3 TaxID=3242698 RepID=UPI00359D8EA9
MTSPDQHTNVEIKFHYNQQYREHVSKGSPDRWIDMSLSAAGEDIYGGSRGIVTGSACIVVLDLLDSIESIRSNDRGIITFDDGPSWLSIAKCDESTVEIAACHTLKGAKSPKNRLDISRTTVVTQQAWEEAVVELSREFYQKITKINPDLQNHETVEQIREKIDTLTGSGG